MKKILKKILSPSIIAVAEKIYWAIFGLPSKLKFTREQYKSLTSLKCFVSYNKYGGYCVPESSRFRPAALAILSNDIYEPKTIEFMMSNCADGDIIHAGTYFGDFFRHFLT